MKPNKEQEKRNFRKQFLLKTAFTFAFFHLFLKSEITNETEKSSIRELSEGFDNIDFALN